jgi:AraC-like DNA-binding protein
MEDIKNINNLYSEKQRRVFLTVRHLLTQETYVNKNLNQAGIVCIVDGSANLVFENGERLPLSSNDCFLYDKERAFSVDFEVPTEIFILHFNFSDFIDEQYVIMEKEIIGTFLSFLKKSCDKISGWHINAKRIQEMLFEIENEIENKDFFAENVIKSYMTVVFSLSIQYFFEELKNETREQHMHYKNIEKSIAYIHENLSQKITLEELSQIAMLGKTNYSVFFKKMTGMTVWEYIINARVELASSYLLENKEEYNISELAFQCGFNNSAYFNKIFKKLKGKTPRDFKKNIDNPCF